MKTNGAPAWAQEQAGDKRAGKHAKTNQTMGSFPFFFFLTIFGWSRTETSHWSVERQFMNLKHFKICVCLGCVAP
jgi:hypothetical protein